MQDRTQIRGDKNNPYHLSVGAILTENNTVYLIKKPDGYLSLPRETTFFEEYLTETLKRGCEEELGIKVELGRFIGTLISHFKREDGTDVEKTTLYFTVILKSKTNRKPKTDEVNDEVVILKISEALEIMKSQSNDEYKILEKLV